MGKTFRGKGEDLPQTASKDAGEGPWTKGPKGKVPPRQSWISKDAPSKGKQVVNA